MRVDDAAFLHFEPEIVAFTGPLADTGEHGHTTVLHGDVVDEFHDDDRLADARTTEQTDFAATKIRFQKIDDLNAGLEHFELGGLVFERRSGTVNREALRRVDGAHVIHGLAENVEHATEGFFADGDRDGTTERDRLHTANQTFGRLHGDGTDAALADVLRGLANDVDGFRDVEAFADDANGGVDFRNLSFGELTVDSRSSNLDDVADNFSGGCHNQILFSRRLFCGRRAANHFDNFFGDCCLPHTIHVQSQRLDNVFRVG